MKYCPKCQQTLPESAFQLRRLSKDRLQYRCRACFKLHARPRVSVKIPHGLIGHKTCSRCGVEKPLAAYHRRSESKNGVQSACKTCQIAWVLRTIDIDRARRTAREYSAAHRVVRVPKPKVELPLEVKRARWRKYNAVAAAKRRANK